MSEFNVTIKGDLALELGLSSLPAKMHDMLLAKVGLLALMLEGKIKSDKLSGQVLKVRNDNLRSSIGSKVVDDGNRIVGSAFSSVDVKYAAIHEFGGIIQHPGSDKLQAWTNAAGKKIVVHGTKPHAIPMPERSFMRSALADMRQTIIDELRMTAIEAALETVVNDAAIGAVAEQSVSRAVE